MNIVRLLLAGVAAIASTCPVAVRAAVPETTPASRPATDRSTETADVYRKAFAALDVLNEADRGRLGLCGKDGCWVVRTPLDAATLDLLNRLEKPLHLAKQAAGGPSPLWSSDGDTARMIEVANQLPTVASLAVLQARQSFADGNPEAGLEALLMALTIARHASAAEPTLMLKMVEVAAHRPAMEALAQQLPSLPRNLLDTLPARLAKLPPSPTMEDLVRGEYRFAKASADKQGFAALLMVSTLQPYYEKIAAAGTVPPDAFAAKVDELSKEYPLNPWVPIIAPSFKKMRELAAAFDTKQALIGAAIAVVLDGEEAITKSNDPFGSGPFTFRKRSAGGFELESKFRYQDQLISLTVGDSALK